MTIRINALAGTAATLLLLTACGADSADDAPQDSTEAPAAQESGSEENGDAPAPSDSGDALDELYADSLHDGIAPAAPGTGYIEVAGERIDFEEVACTIRDDEGAWKFRVDATADTEGVGHMMYIDREIGENIGWNWEDELVQLALLTTPATDDSMAQYSNSMVQHEREQGGAPEWDHGDGPNPVIRVVGEEATATGTLDGIMFAEEPLEGEFIAAATCP